MKTYLQTLLDTSMAYTRAVAEAMPENRFDSRLTDDTWNFGELLSHIAYGIQWWEDNYITGKKTEWAPPPSGKSKSDIMKRLEEAYASLRETVNRAGSSDEVVRGLLSTLDHVTHHRGQAVLHLRAQGITPPDYVY